MYREKKETHKRKCLRPRSFIICRQSNTRLSLWFRVEMESFRWNAMIAFSIIAILCLSELYFRRPFCFVSLPSFHAIYSFYTRWCKSSFCFSNTYFFVFTVWNDLRLSLNFHVVVCLIFILLSKNVRKTEQTLICRVIGSNFTLQIKNGWPSKWVLVFTPMPIT